MKQKFAPLFEPYRLRAGVEIATRFAMAPMVINGSNFDGHITSEDTDFFRRRSQVASLKISGATAVAPYGNAFGNGLGNLDASYVAGMKQLAASMKNGNSLAIMQLFHPGRQAAISYQAEGKVYAPSAIDFPFLNYPVHAFSSEQVEVMVQAFASATRRAMEAGFDGVEIHGANHYLLQQFFSPYSNKRTDLWGGNFEKRCRFPLAVVQAVQDVVKDEGREDFIIGYRFSPEEIHEGSIGYTFDDSLKLIDRVKAMDVDYIHTSLFGPEGYKRRAQVGQYQGQVINQVLKEHLQDEVALIVAGDVTSPEKALDALNYGDLFALGSAAIVEPDYMKKVQEGQDDLISFDVRNRLDDLHLPRAFGRLAHVLSNNQSIPEQTIEALKNRD